MSYPLNDEYWNPQRLRSDPLADSTIESLMSDGSYDSVRTALRGLMHNPTLADDQAMPPSIRSYMETASTLPAWFDAEKIAGAEQIFSDYGLEICFVLLVKSLPECYTMHRGAVVLETTGRLMMHDGRTDKYSRRISLTLQFVVSVMSRGGFATGGRSIEACMKIRLIHAAIRVFMKGQDKEWDRMDLGDPINQEDLCFTLTTFSVSVVEGLSMLGIELNEQQKESINHLWSVGASMIGIHEAHIPFSYPDAKLAQLYFVTRQAAYSEAGSLLTQSLITYVEDLAPSFIPDRTIRHIVHLFLGDELSGCVGLIQNSSGRVHWIDKLIRWLLDIVVKLQSNDGWFGRFMRRMTKSLIQSIIFRLHDNEQVVFSLPVSLRSR